MMRKDKNPVNSNIEQSNQRPAYSFLVFSFVLMLMLSIAVLLPLFPNDFFPYLRIGQEVLETGSIPTTEFMTYTSFSQPAVYLYWLPSALMLKLYQWGGVTLIGIMAALCIAGFYSLLWLCLRELKISPITSGFILLLTAVVGINDWSTRPQLLTYPLFGLALLDVLRWQKRDHRLLWTLPVIAMLWANFHGSFVVLFFILVPALIFGSGDRKRLIIFTFLALAATCINYYGFDLWMNMFSMVNSASIRQFSLEWLPPSNKGWQANIFFGMLLAIPLLTAIVRPKIKLLYWVWFAGFGWMALSAVRYGIWFMAVEGFVLALILNPWVEKRLESTTRFQNRGFNLVLGIILLACPIGLLPGVRSLWWQQAPAALSESTPVEAAEWLRNHPELPGELWSDFTYSTYLTYALPERRLFTTNRFEDFSIDQLSENQHIARGDADWQELLDEYQVNLIMVSLKAEPDLLAAASSSVVWDEVYRDDSSVIFTRAGDE